MSGVLEVAGLGRRRAGREVLSGVSFSLAEGRVAGVLGPSGAGKTTLLRLIAGLEVPDEGEIFLDGALASRPGEAAIPPRGRGIGLVPQGYALWPHLDAFENAAFPLRARGVADEETRRRTMETLESLGAAALARRRPAELSGGEQQRVALARALVARPRLLLLDEPLTGLDAPAREEARRVLARALRASGAAAILVTHDHAEALAVCDRLLLLFDGRIVQDGAADEVWRHPSGPEAAALLGAATRLAGAARAGRAELAAGVSLPGAPGADGEPLTALFRSEDLSLSGSGPGWDGAVRSRRPHGGGWLVEVETEAGLLLVAADDAPAPPARVRVFPSPGRAKIFMDRRAPDRKPNGSPPPPP
jgi:ABC-type Fe3+/spermidine/putrescine transport system ATPase subunit